MHTHWSQFVPNMSTRHPRTLSSTASPSEEEKEEGQKRVSALPLMCQGDASATRGDVLSHL